MPHLLDSSARMLQTYTMNGQTLGYIRCSSVEQNSARQLDGVKLDRVFEDKASAKDTARPLLQDLLSYARAGDKIVCHSMDRLARNLLDLRRIVDDLTARGVSVHFVKENLTFTNHEDNMSKLMLNIMGAVAEFERSMILERQREGIAIAKREGKYRGRKPTLNAEQIAKAKERLAFGVPHAAVARECGVSRQTLYQYVRSSAD